MFPGEMLIIFVKLKGINYLKVYKHVESNIDVTHISKSNLSFKHANFDIQTFCVIARRTQGGEEARWLEANDSLKMQFVHKFHVVRPVTLFTSVL